MKNIFNEIKLVESKKRMPIICNEAANISVTPAKCTLIQKLENFKNPMREIKFTTTPSNIKIYPNISSTLLLSHL
jgi:hypothetical protein